MNIVSYCDKRYEQATARAVGQSARRLTCPPSYGPSLSQYATMFAAADLIYLNLHGAPDRRAWYTTSGAIAVTAEEWQVLSIGRAVVYLVNCYAGGGMLDVLKAQQPRAIVGGCGENLGALGALAGADLLGLWFRRWLQRGANPRIALRLAKARLSLGAQTASVKDALAFEVLYERSLQ